jgi:hypothetical protein
MGRWSAAYIIRFGPESGLKSDIAPGPKSADFVAKVGCYRWIGRPFRKGRPALIRRL